MTLNLFIAPEATDGLERYLFKQLWALRVRIFSPTDGSERDSSRAPATFERIQFSSPRTSERISRTPCPHTPPLIAHSGRHGYAVPETIRFLGFLRQRNQGFCQHINTLFVCLLTNNFAENFCAMRRSWKMMLSPSGRSCSTCATNVNSLLVFVYLENDMSKLIKCALDRP